MQPIELANIKGIKVGLHTNKDGRPEATFSFTTTADPSLVASIITEGSQRPLTVTITSPQTKFGEKPPAESKHGGKKP